MASSVVLCLGAAVMVLLAACQRVRDIGWHPLWMIVITALPFGIGCLVLCLLPGSRGSNRYGADPLNRATPASRSHGPNRIEPTLSA